MDTAPPPAIPATCDAVAMDQARHNAATNHWTLLVLSIVILLLSLTLDVPAERRVVIPGLNMALPELCTFRQFTGQDCPGCGLTRCFISMAHCDLPRAWHFHPVGVFFFFIVLTQIPFRIYQLTRLRRGLRPLSHRSLELFPAVVLLAFCTRWIFQAFLSG